MKGWDKTKQRRLYQPFILTMQVLALLIIRLMSRSGQWNNRVGSETLAFVPAALLGTWFGLMIFKRLSDRQFDLAINLLLAASGAGFVV